MVLDPAKAAEAFRQTARLILKTEYGVTGPPICGTEVDEMPAAAMTLEQLGRAYDSSVRQEERASLHLERIERVRALILLERMAKRVRSGTVNAVAVRDVLAPLSIHRAYNNRTDYLEPLRELTRNRPDVVLPVSVPTLRLAFDLVVAHRIGIDAAHRAFGIPRTRCSSYVSLARRRERRRRMAE